MPYSFSPDKPEKHQQLIRSAARWSLCVALFLIAIKLITYFLTNSVIILSSLIDSILDSAASLINLLALKQALKPSDYDHRFGHGKAEPLAGLAQTFFILGSSALLLFEAVNRLINPSTIKHGLLGIGVITFSLLVTILLVLYQRWVIKKTNSLAIQADQLHYLSDVLMNSTMIAGLVVVHYWGWEVVDPICGIVVAATIVIFAYRIVRQSLGQLMDEELSDHERELIVKQALAHSEVKALHELRTRRSGQNVFIQMHLEMDGRLLLHRSHHICKEVMDQLKQVYPNADILIHQDPIDDTDDDGDQKERYVADPEIPPADEMH